MKQTLRSTRRQSWTILARMKTARLLTILGAVLIASAAASAQTPSPTPISPAKQANRDATREKLRALLNNLPSDLNMTFKPSSAQPYNFVGTLTTGVKNAQAYEVVISVTASDTIGFRVYPHYNNGYVNIDKARNSVGLLRQLVNLTDHNFLFWGADDTSDVFAGYTITLESGFPDAALRTVLYSVKPLDEFVGRMRPNIDGTTASPR